MKPLVLLCALMTAAPAAAADKEIRAFFGGTFGGGTTLVDLEHAAGKWNPAIGASFVTISNVFGLDVEVANAPGFFQSGDSHLVLSSHVTTITGNLVIAAPRSKTEYGLRPYIVAGGGVMRADKKDSFGIFPARTLGTFDFGGGVVGFFTNRSGVSWEIRRFEGLSGGEDPPGTTIGGEPGRLSFWRATMAFVYRY